ncbi:protein containing DUF343 [mine drainage metagenome]|uniref:Protein containing DUF343 n=1 Tax=mine drainage metagenome TaxID=410659 RepID=T0YQ79_9ZZZZ
MHDDLLEILCCPLCKADLTLKVTKREKGEIEEGTLTCTKCATVFPIEEGIPNLLPPGERD